MDVNKTSGTSPVLSPWLTANEAAAYLKVNPRTILQWAKQGKVRAFKLSGTERIVWRFQTSDLDATLTAPSVADHGGNRATF